MIYELKRVRNAQGQTIRYRLTKTEGIAREEIATLPEAEDFRVKTSRVTTAVFAILCLLEEEFISKKEAVILIDQVY